MYRSSILIRTFVYQTSQRHDRRTVAAHICFFSKISVIRAQLILTLRNIWVIRCDHTRRIRRVHLAMNKVCVATRDTFQDFQIEFWLEIASVNAQLLLQRSSVTWQNANVELSIDIFEKSMNSRLTTRSQMMTSNEIHCEDIIFTLQSSSASWQHAQLDIIKTHCTDIQIELQQRINKFWLKFQNDLKSTTRIIDQQLHHFRWFDYQTRTEDWKILISNTIDMLQLSVRFFHA